MTTTDAGGPDGNSRRAFLAKAGLGAAAAWTAPVIMSTAAHAATSASSPTSSSSPTSTATGSAPLLSVDAAQSPVQHIVILMMENRSFDHWLGWLSTEAGYLAAGRSRYGGGFHVEADLHQTFPGPSGPIATMPMLQQLASGNPYRGCDHPDPGHGWDAGRAERDGGFVSPGSGNDFYALGYYQGDDLPFTSQLAKRFTVCDHSFASVLGPTYPNRQYLLSATSNGVKDNSTKNLPYTQPMLHERLVAAGVSVRYYYSDLPTALLFGGRVAPFLHKIDDYFADCAAGTLPQVSFVDPAFSDPARTDNHPHGDIRAGERFVRDVFAAFARSPHWSDGVFFLTYDEWGGFFDHVAPPQFPDDRASAVDEDNFGQAGFRVPTVVCSPFARPGSLDHTMYDHTSIDRFVEWRFLGAPAEGSAGSGWWLTARDRNAYNIGASLVTNPITELDIDLDVAIGDPSPGCVGEAGTVSVVEPATAGDKHSMQVTFEEGWFDQFGVDTTPSPMVHDWVVA
jgi:phospholipase C